MRTDDGSIIQDCLDGESEAFGILVDKYKAGIYAFAYSKLGNFQDAQDITQEVFLEAYSNLRKLRRWDSFSFWIYRMASTLCKKWIQNQMKRPDLKYIDDLDTGSLETPTINSYYENKLYDFVQEALNSLPETYREILMLRYFAGMNSKEIATALGLSPTAIRMRLSRAREQLKEEMIAMMGTAFDEQRLQASFTFRIVEAVKRIRIHPISQMKGLPWGISLATGLLITVLSINPALISFDHIGTSIYSPLPIESKVLKIGEIPVDVVKTSSIAILSSKIGKGKGGEPENMQNAFFMAPKGEGGIWAKKADMPTARGYLSSSAMNGKIYVIGGLNWNGIIATMEEYDSVNDKWLSKANMPTERSGLATSVVNGKIYAIGGAIINNNITQTVEEYDPVSDKWTKKADMPTARNCLSTSVVNGKIYAIGGWNGNVNLSAVETVEEYDPELDKWTRKTDMPTARNGHAASVVNGKIYAIGGWGDGCFIPTVEEYDPVADEWTKKADMPTVRGDLATSVLDGKIYAIGGFSDPNGMDGLPTVEVYDPVADKWTKGVDMTTGRGLLTASEDNGRLYVVGGFSKFTPRTILSTVEEYIPEGWKAVSPQRKLPKTWGKIKLISFDHIRTPIYSPLPVEPKVLKVSEIPVGVVKTSNIAVISSKMGKGKGGEPENMQNAFLMAPKGEKDTWIQKADMPTARTGRTAVVNGKIYAIGGSPDDVHLLCTVEEYDPKEDKWIKKADMPTARDAMGVSVVNGKIYVIGGWMEGYIATSAVEEYDPLIDKWANKADMPTARWCLSTCVVNEKIYAIGGWNRKTGTLFSTVEEYDPANDKWTKKADMPTARDRFVTGVVNGKIYAIGGALRSGNLPHPVVANVEEYDPNTDTWIKKNDMPAARGGSCSAVLNDKIYVMGGIPNMMMLNKSDSIVEEYDPATDTWTKRKDMPMDRAFASASVLDGKIYVVGGVESDIPQGLWKPLSTVEEYTPEDWQSVSPQGKLPKTWGNIKSK